MDLSILSDVGKQATEMINSETTTGATETAAAVPATPTTPQGEQPSTQTPAVAAPAQPGQAPTTAEAKIYEIDLGGGRVEKFTADQLKDWRDNGLRYSDYTRKQQEVARQRAEAEAIVLQNQQLKAELERRAGVQPQNPNQPVPQQQQQPQIEFDPTKPMTMGDAQRLAMAFQERLQQIEAMAGPNAEQARQLASQIVEDRLEVAKHAETINQTLAEIYKERPVLKALPEFEDMLRFRVLQLKPETPEATITAFKEVSKEIASNIDRLYEAKQQQLVAQRQSLTTQGIEPPTSSGAVPQPPAKNYRTSDNKLDWRALAQDALQLAQEG